MPGKTKQSSKPKPKRPSFDYCTELKRFEARYREWAKKNHPLSGDEQNSDSTTDDDEEHNSVSAESETDGLSPSAGLNAKKAAQVDGKSTSRGHVIANQAGRKRKERPEASSDEEDATRSKHSSRRAALYIDVPPRKKVAREEKGNEKLSLVERTKRLKEVQVDMQQDTADMNPSNKSKGKAKGPKEKMGGERVCTACENMGTVCLPSEGSNVCQPCRRRRSGCSPGFGRAGQSPRDLVMQPEIVRAMLEEIQALTSAVKEIAQEVAGLRAENSFVKSSIGQLVGAIGKGSKKTAGGSEETTIISIRHL